VQLDPPLRGIIPPLITPLLSDDALDVAGLERLVEHVLADGVHGLFILGTTGEGPALSYRLREQMIERVCRQVDERVPVLVGITDTIYAESVRMAQIAAEAGAAAVVTAGPFYFPLAQGDLVRFVENLAIDSPLPIYLYNMPSHTKVTFELDTLRRAFDIPKVAGLKDSSAQMIYFHRVRQLIAERSDLSLLVGPEELLGEAVLMGGHGGVCGGANLAPRLYVELYEAAARGDSARVGELHAQVMRIASTIYELPGRSSLVIRGLKTSLSILGIASDVATEPLGRPTDDERRRIERTLNELGIVAVTSTAG